MIVVLVGQSALASFFKLCMLLIAFILILVASYYVTRWYAQSGFVRRQNHNMEIVDTLSMGPNRQICIVRIGQKYIAVSVCKDHIRFLTEVSGDEIEFEPKTETETRLRMSRFKQLFFRKSIWKGLFTIAVFMLVFFVSAPAYSAAAKRVDQTTQDEIAGDADADDDTFDLNISSNLGSTRLESTLQILIMLTILALAPSILIMVTSFTRIIVVFHFLRTAIGTQTTPPNQVLVGLALFMTIAIMTPVFTQVYDDGVKPYTQGQMEEKEAVEAGLKPLRKFMLGQTRDKDLKLFMKINDTSSDEIKDYDDLSITTIIPAFIISELRTAFIIGFVIYLPFIVIDMVVASTLMSMGMMMLPPTTISLPFKILLFVLADGWNLIVDQLVRSFQ